MPQINTDKKRMIEILDRGIVAEILPSKEEFLSRLLSGQRLKIYIGVDPTGDSLHLSHAKNYMFLEELRQLGHEVVVLIGDFTAQIGDPSGKSDTRSQLTEEKIKENVGSMVSQIKPLLNFTDTDNPPRIVYNSQWLARLTFKEVVYLASQFTVQQMIERDMFQKRWDSHHPIYLHEFLYPLMQGYDSVSLEVDAELCGTDQIFNALAGRTLLKRLKNKDKFVVALNLMANPKTGELMSKSKGKGVFLTSGPNEMYGAIMAQPDEMTEVLFINCTRIPLPEKSKIMALGPMEAKARVALEIVKKIYGEEKAKKAQEEFKTVFQEKGNPKEIGILEFKSNDVDPLEIMIKAGINSRSEAKRLIEEGAMEIDDRKIIDWREKLVHKDGEIVKIGSRKYFQIKILEN